MNEAQIMFIVKPNVCLNQGQSVFESVYHPPGQAQYHRHLCCRTVNEATSPVVRDA